MEKGSAKPMRHVIGMRVARTIIKRVDAAAQKLGVSRTAWITIAMTEKLRRDEEEFLK